MKRIIKVLVIVFVMFMFSKVNAANYELRELIPINTETTIVTDHFSYQSFYYKTKGIKDITNPNNYLIFSNIKNISDEDLPISI